MYSFYPALYINRCTNLIYLLVNLAFLPFYFSLLSALVFVHIKLSDYPFKLCSYLHFLVSVSHVPILYVFAFMLFLSLLFICLSFFINRLSYLSINLQYL
jgi:hypothetical protein